MTPTTEQIEAERINAATFRLCYGDKADETTLAAALATARLEGRNAALDEAAKIARDEDGYFTWAGMDSNARMLERCAAEISVAILSLKEPKP